MQSPSRTSPPRLVPTEKTRSAEDEEDLYLPGVAVNTRGIRNVLQCERRV